MKIMVKDKNYVDQLSEYIVKNLKKGYTKESLKWALVQQGHAKLEVEKAMKKADEFMAATAPVLETKPEIKYESVPPVVIPEKLPWYKRMLGFK
jgi:hypothetical protein